MLIGAFHNALALARRGLFAVLLCGMGAQAESLSALWEDALAKERSGQAEKSAQVYETIAALNPSLEAYAKLRAARLWMAVQNWKEAARALPSADGLQMTADEVLLTAAELSLKLPELQVDDKALEGLAQRDKPLKGRDWGGDALWWLAQRKHRAGDGAGARAALAKLWARHPHSSWEEAGLLLDEVTKDPRKAVERAERLVDLHQSEEAEALAAAWAARSKLPQEFRCRMELAWGRSLRKQRKHSEAVGLLQTSLPRCARDSTLPAMLYTAAYSASVVNPQKALDWTRALAAMGPEVSLADDALWLQAQTERKLGRLEAAQKSLETLTQVFPQSEFAADAAFYRYWWWREAGFKERSLGALEILERSLRSPAALSGATRDRIRYWTLRDRLDGDVRNQAAGFAMLAQESPLSYYGLLARGFLAKAAPEVSAKVEADLGALWTVRPLALDSDGAANAPEESEWLALVRLGEKLAAWERSQRWLRSKPNQGRALTLCQQLVEAGDLVSPHWMLRTQWQSLLEGRLSDENRLLWEWAFPLAYLEEVRLAATEAGIDPELLTGLMREESGFDPDALSWAGARGLTQLMPATARETAAGLGLRISDLSQLNVPAFNLRLGARYLAELAAAHRGNLFYAVASYNAGPRAVRRWRSQWTGDLDAWVESIPLEETKAYVKRVLRSRGVYRQALGISVEVGAVEGLGESPRP